MILRPLITCLAPIRSPLDRGGVPELRAWLLELRAILAPESIAGYVRGLKAFGNWCAAEELGTAPGFRALRRPHAPRRLIALVLLLLDTGLRLAEMTGLRVGDLRPDGTMRVMGKGSKERIVPLGATARRAILRYVAERGVVRPADPLFLGRRGGPLGRRTLQIAVADLGRRAGVGTRCSPHTVRHTFARSYNVNGGDVLARLPREHELVGGRPALAPGSRSRGTARDDRGRGTRALGGAARRVPQACRLRTAIAPETRHQRCWNHRAKNLSDKVRKRLQPELRHRLRAVWNAPSRHECELRRDELARWLHARGQDPAAETLFRDWDDFTTFFDFPAEHWIHLRTSNPVSVAP